MPEFDQSLFIYGLTVGIGAGLLAGLMAGLAGVGGGLIYVPVFYALMPGHSEHMGTYIFASFIAIIITGLFSTRSHWRLGHVHLASLYQLLPGLIIGSGIGLWSTLHISGSWILLSLAALNAWVAFDYSHQAKSLLQKAPLLPLLSGPIGFFSGLLGIGGGTMLVPLLRRSLILRQAVGTSATAGLIMALTATALNISFESSWYHTLRMQWVFLSGAGLGIIFILPHSIHWATLLHERISEALLRCILKSMFTSLSIGLLLAAIFSR